jgi:hypothetical protein
MFTAIVFLSISGNNGRMCAIYRTFSSAGRLSSFECFMQHSRKHSECALAHYAHRAKLHTVPWHAFAGEPKTLSEFFGNVALDSLF